MNLEKEMKKYGIPIPEDTENYDKEIYKKFDNMYLRSFYNTFYNVWYFNDNTKSYKFI